MGPVLVNGTVLATLGALAALGLEIVIQNKMRMSDPSGGTGGGGGDPLGSDEGLLDRIVEHSLEGHGGEWAEALEGVQLRGSFRDMVKNRIRQAMREGKRYNDPTNPGSYVFTHNKLIVRQDPSGGGTAFFKPSSREVLDYILRRGLQQVP